MDSAMWCEQFLNLIYSLISLFLCSSKIVYISCLRWEYEDIIKRASCDPKGSGSVLVHEKYFLINWPDWGGNITNIPVHFHNFHISQASSSRWNPRKGRVRTKKKWSAEVWILTCLLSVSPLTTPRLELNFCKCA